MGGGSETILRVRFRVRVPRSDEILSSASVDLVGPDNICSKADESGVELTLGAIGLWELGSCLIGARPDR